MAGWTNWVGECAHTHPAWTNLLHLGLCTNLLSFATNTCRWYTNTLTVGSASFVLPAVCHVAGLVCRLAR